MPWSVVQTYPNAAGSNYADDAPTPKLPVALRNLRRQGFEFYNPRFMQTVVLHGAKVMKRVQLFEDYVFVRAGERWRALRSTRGVVQLLSAVASDNMIEQLRKHENGEGLFVLGSSSFRIGQRVEVKAGPFAYEKGLFDGQSSARDRVFVMLSLLGAPRRVEMNEGNLIEA